MPLTFFIYISFILTAVLLFYGLSILVFSLIYGSNKRKAKIEANSFKKSVEIIIPCHNEGREVIDTIESLSSQTYSAPKNIFLLVCDETDSSIPFITEKYGLISEKPFYLKNNTKFFVILTGVKGKKEKLNYHLPHLSSDYVALLDADHVATHSWLSQSIVLLEKTEKNVCGVQSRREPKSLKNFFQIWDSAQNHIGNELLNISLEKAKLPIFFTGTTAVFKKNTFDNLVFSDSITEDTYLSYDLLLQGKELIYNKLTGSRESVSPTLSDYIARRRRWSNGHTQNFFKHLKEIIFSPILLSKRKSLLFVHGIFFLIPIVAIILLNIFQGFYFFQYSNNIKFFVLAGSLGLSFVTTYFLAKGYGRFFKDSILSLVYVIPFFLLLSLHFFKLFTFEFYNFIISFPYVDDFLGYIQLAIFLIPLVILLYGASKIKLFSRKHIFILIISYPLIIFFDMYAFVLGFFDYIFGVRTWRIINRDTKERLSKKQKYLILSTSLILTIFMGVYLFPKNNCHESTNPLVSTFYNIVSPFSPRWDSGYTKTKNTNDNNLIVEFSGEIEYSSSRKKNKQLEITLNNSKNIINIDEKGSYRYQATLPFGFDTHSAVLSLDGSHCSRTLTFTDTLKEVKDSVILVNAEPFLIKGVIPAFSQPDINLASDAGIKQISSLGANLLRIYHVPSSDFMEKISENKMFIIPQPARSNWSDNDFFFRGTSGLYRRYLRLHKQVVNNPFVLALNLGNELEINDKKNIEKIKEVLLRIKSQDLDLLSLYSTYLSYVHYPGDLIGINMLDTGKVYWDKTIPLLKDFNAPIIATEIGGFAAFFEDIDPRIRSLRLREQWEKLISLKSSGAIIFQSHDNWAQPVVTGYNNPFVAEQPDDTRGIWDRENNEKFVANTVRSIFSDLSVEYLTEDLFNEGIIEIKLSNKRSYNIQSIALFKNSSEYKKIGNINIDENMTISIPREEFVKDNSFELRYETHSGLFGVQVLSSPIILPEALPFIFDKSQLFINKKTNNTLSGDILDSEFVVYVPDTWKVENEHSSSKSKKIIKDTQYFYKAKNLTVYKNAIYQGGIAYVSEKAPYSVKFNFDKPVLKKSLLILEGMGTSEIELIIQNSKHIISVHPYRENVIDLNEYISSEYRGEFIINFYRFSDVYISKEYSSQNKDIVIDFQNPKLFQPQELVIEKK